MAEWKVSKQIIKLSPHPDAEKLEIANLGGYQLVCQKGLYKDGDVVVFVPEKSILTSELAEPYKNYLAGSEKNRVKSVKLRGEISCGIILPNNERYDKFIVDEDMSEFLGIKKYEPPVPAQLAGDVDSIGSLNSIGMEISQHDVEHYRVFKDEFLMDEDIYVTEKVHGSQCIIIRTTLGERAISSKGLLSKSLILKESETNSYWVGSRNTKIFDLLDQYYPNVHAQAFGELVPCQKGFSYGFANPTILLFDIRINGKSIPFSELNNDFTKLWVPVLYNGKFDEEAIKNLRLGKEEVSGKQLHIKEGVVVRPVKDRRSSKGFRLFLKYLNPEYRDDPDAIN